MTDYIKRDDAIRCIMEHKGMTPIAKLEAETAICRIPAADVRVVKRGNWVKQEDGACFCSVCQFGLESFVEGVFYNFCPYCGAQMDEENKP